ncbi:hypothetical protein CBR_g77111, partial [Chara braunii]
GQLSRGCIKPRRPRMENGGNSAASTLASNAERQIVLVTGPGPIQPVNNQGDGGYGYRNFNNNNNNHNNLTSNREMVEAIFTMREFCLTMMQEKKEERERRKEEEERRRREEEQRQLREERERLELEKQQRADEREARFALIIKSEMASKDQSYQVIMEQLAKQNKMLREVVDGLKAGTAKNPIMIEDMRRDILLLREAELERGRRKRSKEGSGTKEPTGRQKQAEVSERELKLSEELLGMEERHREQMKVMREEIESLKAAQLTTAPTPSTPSTSRARTCTPMSGLRTVEPAELFAKTAPNPVRKTTGQKRCGRSVSDEPLGFDKLVPGKKVVVAEPGDEWRQKFLEDTRRFLRSKNVPVLAKMCKDEKLTAKSNRKEDLVEALAEARVRMAYGNREQAQPVRISEQVDPNDQGTEMVE